ncbi:hypothetical protein D3C84_1116020 [compost metagenome]
MINRTGHACGAQAYGCVVPVQQSNTNTMSTGPGCQVYCKGLIARKMGIGNGVADISRATRRSTHAIKANVE